MVKTPHFHCRGHRFDSQPGNLDPTGCTVWPKKKKNKTKTETNLVTWALASVRMAERINLGTLLKGHDDLIPYHFFTTVPID